MEILLRSASLTAKRLCLGKIVFAGALATLPVFAGQVAAQVEYVDPTIGNVGILLVPTRPDGVSAQQHGPLVSDARGCDGRPDRVVSADDQFSSDAGTVQHHARRGRARRPTTRKRPLLITTRRALTIR